MVKVFMDQPTTEHFRHNSMGISSRPKTNFLSVATYTSITAELMTLIFAMLAYHRRLPSMLQRYIDDITNLEWLICTSGDQIVRTNATKCMYLFTFSHGHLASSCSYQLDAVISIVRKLSPNITQFSSTFYPFSSWIVRYYFYPRNIYFSHLRVMYSNLKC